MMKSTILLRLDQDLKDKLKEVSIRERRSLTSLILKILDDHVNSISERAQNGE